MVPKTRDALFLFRPDGTSERRPLQPGETRRIFDRLDYETKNIAAVVEKAYSEQHSRSVP